MEAPRLLGVLGGIHGRLGDEHPGLCGVALALGTCLACLRDGKEASVAGRE